MSINKVILVGNVGKDPEVRHLQGGASVATITLATSERYKDRSGETREMTEWHTIIAWRQLADLAENYIRKGSQLYVEGKIRSRSWDDQNGQKRYVTEIQADTIQLLGRRSDNPGTQQAPQPQGYSQPTAPSYGGYSAPAQPQHHTPAQQPTTPIVNPADLTDDGTDDLPF
ncbi:MAG: single-stranded DNA-binding protein [Bacteroidales bacterium]|nr:single-stranded DNA-binding protein [Bacteroidales bacterium]